MNSNMFMLGFLTSLLMGCAVMPLGKVVEDDQETAHVIDMDEEDIEKDKL